MAEILGATGIFPDGKMEDNDEGELQLGIATHKQCVVVFFGKAISWFAGPPNDLLQIAGSLEEKAEGLPEVVVRQTMPLIAIGLQAGLVRLDFDSPVDRLILNGDTARRLATAIRAAVDKVVETNVL